MIQFIKEAPVLDVIESFDNYLYERNLKFEAVIIGGAALIVMNVITRATKDIDCLDPDIPHEIKKASEEFSLETKDFHLSRNWLNNGPQSLKLNLPTGWKRRLQELYRGRSIHFQTLERVDLLKSKLFACADRDFDFDDCLKLNPSKEELYESVFWVKEQDQNPLWTKRVDVVFTKIAEALNYEWP